MRYMPDLIRPSDVFCSQTATRGQTKHRHNAMPIEFDLIIREFLEYTRAGDRVPSVTSKFGNSVMLYSPRMRLLPLFALLLAGFLLISPRFAHAQFPQGENKWAVMDVTSAVNNAIDESKDGVELREKIVRRFSECSLMYGGLSTLASNAEAKKSYVQAQLATMEIESTVAKPLQTEKRLEIEEAARKSVAVMLRALNAQRDKDKDVGLLLKNCKALNDTKEIKNAVRELSRQ